MKPLIALWIFCLILFFGLAAWVFWPRVSASAVLPSERVEYPTLNASPVGYLDAS